MPLQPLPFDGDFRTGGITTTAYARERVIEFARKAGFTVLTDDEVVIRHRSEGAPAYYEVIDPQPNTNYLLNPDHVWGYAMYDHRVSDAYAAPANATVYIPPDARRLNPLRVRLFGYTGSNACNMYVDTRGRQAATYTTDYGYADTAVAQTYAVTPSVVCRSLRAVPRAMRDMLISKVRARLEWTYSALEQPESVVCRNLLANIHRLQRARSNPTSTQHVWARNGGLAIYRGTYPRYKKLLAEFGDCVRRAINGDYGDYDNTALDAVIAISGYSASVADDLVNRWNSHSNLEMRRGECGHIFWDHEGHAVSVGVVCGDCFDDDYVFCVDTDEYHLREFVYYHESDGEYRTYEERDDACDYCIGNLSGWSESTSHLGHDKSFTPCHDGDFTMGIELEVEAEYDRDEDDDEEDSPNRRACVAACHEHFNEGRKADLYAMFKRDGSLNDAYGFEIVTAARRMGDHIEKFSTWKPRGLRAWDAGNCGMHVHIDSRAFTGLTLGKFLMFFNQARNTKFIRGIAGRHPDTDAQARSYANRVSASAAEHPVRVKSVSDHDSRYRMVNMTNLTQTEQDRLGMSVDRCSKGSYSTVELRIFRATLRKDRLLAQIEFAHAAVAFCRVASWQDLTADSFLAWLATQGGYTNLRRWYGVSAARNKTLQTAANRASVATEI